MSAKNITDNLTIIFLGILLFVFYSSNIPYMKTIWECPDEAVYLFNAAFLSGHNWTEAFGSIAAYYGYGYSVLLIPFFLVCNSGLDIIRGAVAVNALCVLLIYVLLIYIVGKIFPISVIGKKVLAFISMITCLFPYIVCNSMKVVPEVFLTSLVLLTGVFLYKALGDNKKRHYTMVFFLMVFMVFTHIRAIAVCLSAICVLLVAVLRKRARLRNILIGLIPIVFIYIVMQYIKSNISGALVSRICADNDKPIAISNIVNMEYLLNRLKWLFLPENISKYFFCAIGKLFYIITSTLGMFLLGINETVRFLKNKIETCHYDNSFFVLLYFALTFALMYIMSCINGTGEQYSYFLYGRYYEYTLPVIICIGIYSSIRTRRKKNLVLYIVATFVCGVISLKLEMYTTSSDVLLDTSRLAGLSFLIQDGRKYCDVVVLGVKSVVLWLGVMCIMSKNRIYTQIIPLCILVWFMASDIVCISHIRWINDRNKSDTEMAFYIENNHKEAQLWFMEEEFMYPNFYVRMQVFLKDYTMHVVFSENEGEIPKGSYVITYKNSSFVESISLTDNMEFIMDSRYYKLFIKK